MKETRGILQTTSQLKSNNCVVVTSSLSWGVGTAALQHRTAFLSLMAEWWVDKQRDNKEKDVSSPAIVLRIHLCLWWAHFHPTRTTACWFVCSRRWRRWGGPENKRRPSCTRTMLLLPAGQRSIRPPGPQRGWRCGANLREHREVELNKTLPAELSRTPFKGAFPAARASTHGVVSGKHQSNKSATHLSVVPPPPLGLRLKNRPQTVTFCQKT